MKKGWGKFFCVLTFVGCVVSTAGAAHADFLQDLDERLELSGDIMTMATYLTNYRGKGGDDGAIITRALVALDSKITDTLLLRSELGYWQNWQHYRKTYHASELEDAPESADPVVANLYLQLTDFWQGFSVTLGRQYMGEKEDAFFYYGPHSGRFLELTAIDAVKVDKNWAKINWSTFFGQRAKMGTGIAMEGNYDELIYGLEAQTDEIFEGHNFRMGTYYRKRVDDTLGEKSNLVLWTLKGDGKTFIDNLAYAFLLGINAGEDDIANKDYAGWLARLKGDYSIKLEEDNAIDLNAGYVYVSGDKLASPGKDENFRRLGRDCFYSMAYITYEVLNDSYAEDVVNVKIPFVGVEYSFGGKGEQMENKIYKEYGITTKDKITVGTRYALLDCVTAISGEKGKATEANAYIKYELNKNVSFQLVGARFWPRGYLEKVFKSGKPTNQVSLYTEVRF
ncbi:MAG TPA: hypothetical protein PLT76_02960 [Candidatus Omnitrophota bacterium]|nr:hypothetical protein [Candidatus Omnitrophota bacterium]HQO57666.1 hypothetical protein [Candidatus Omnitrophota bacterium]